MAAILAQMRGNAICPRLLRNLGGAQGVRIGPAARITHRGHMVDIDT